jgi:hypothetical protein
MGAAPRASWIAKPSTAKMPPPTIPPIPIATVLARPSVRCTPIDRFGGDPDCEGPPTQRTLTSMVRTPHQYAGGRERTDNQNSGLPLRGRVRVDPSETVQSSR